MRLQLNGLEDNDLTGGRAFEKKAVKMSLLTPYYVYYRLMPFLPSPP